jgi:hypothetical protein
MNFADQIFNLLHLINNESDLKKINITNYLKTKIIKYVNNDQPIETLYQLSNCNPSKEVTNYNQYIRNLYYLQNIQSNYLDTLPIYKATPYDLFTTRNIPIYKLKCQISSIKHLTLKSIDGKHQILGTFLNHDFNINIPNSYLLEVKQYTLKNKSFNITIPHKSQILMLSDEKIFIDNIDNIDNFDTRTEIIVDVICLVIKNPIHAMLFEHKPLINTEYLMDTVNYGFNNWCYNICITQYITNEIQNKKIQENPLYHKFIFKK